VSAAGGTQPHWSHTGHELFYLDAEGGVVSVRVGQGTTWSAAPGTRTPLADGTYLGAAGRNTDVSPDGKRFLLIKAAATASQPSTPTSIVVVAPTSRRILRKP
jgi:hypothetical protein